MSRPRSQRVVLQKKGPAIPWLFYSVLGVAGYWFISALTFTYIDERDFRAARAEETRQAWSRTAEGQAQLADLAEKDAARNAADAKRQLDLMETEAGREELARERKLKVADLRHREMKLLYDLANKQRDINRSREAVLEEVQREAVQRRAREAAGLGEASTSRGFFGFGWGGTA